MATKQDLQKPRRPLSLQDLNYIFHIKFAHDNSLIPAKDTMITEKQFDKFWEWFGPGLHKIRYQRHLCPLWERGLICGFISRSEADKVLMNATPGTFLIRLSERCPGQFAIAYVCQDAQTSEPKIRHYLVQPDDVFGAKKTLPDFLGQARNFTHLVQINTCNDKRVYRQCDKNATLGEFYAKRSFENPYGYDDSLVGQPM